MTETEDQPAEQPAEQTIPYVLPYHSVERIERAVRLLRKAQVALSMAHSQVRVGLWPHQPTDASEAQVLHDTLALHLATLAHVEGALARLAGEHTHRRTAATAKTVRRSWREIWDDSEGDPNA
jgi:hypothetical protein